MNQEKIGKFIAQRRKIVGLTQMQLAEKLGVTDRAVSKWETGKSMPDTSIMLDLCKILSISVNELLTGEEIFMENLKENNEKLIMELAQQKEEADKRLLRMEVLLGVISIIFMLAMIVIASLMQMEDWLRVLLCFASVVPLLVAMPFMLKIEQVAGYYECGECGHRYVPTFKAVNLAPHMGRTRHMKCPKCGQKTWQKKVIRKEK